MLDLHQFLIVRPQPLNLPVKEADLGVFRLDLKETIITSRLERRETNLRPEGGSLLLQLACQICHLNVKLRSDLPVL